MKPATAFLPRFQGRCSAHAAVWLLAWLLTACASRPPLAQPDEALLTGRLALRVAADGGTAERSLTMAFDLRGSPAAGRAEFTSPLGSMLAQARWSPERVVLITDQGENQFADLDSMSREVLGAVVPVAALFDWLRGRPWPGAESRPTAGGMGFEQLGWAVDLSRFADSLVVARRSAAPVVTVRAVIDSR